MHLEMVLRECRARRRVRCRARTGQRSLHLQRPLDTRDRYLARSLRLRPLLDPPAETRAPVDTNAAARRLGHQSRTTSSCQSDTRRPRLRHRSPRCHRRPTGEMSAGRAATQHLLALTRRSSRNSVRQRRVCASCIRVRHVSHARRHRV